MNNWINRYRAEVDHCKEQEKEDYDVYDAIQDLDKMGGVSNIMSRNEYDAILEEVKKTKDPKHRRAGMNAILGLYYSWQNAR